MAQQINVVIRFGGLTMSKQTTVRWLFQKLWDTPKDKFEWQSIFLMAHQMHKEEIAKTWDDSLDNLKARGMNEMRAYTDFDEYYNETFGGQDNE